MNKYKPGAGRRKTEAAAGAGAATATATSPDSNGRVTPLSDWSDAE